MKKFNFFAFVLFILSFPLVGKSQISGENKENLSISIDKKDASSENATDGYIKLKITGGTAPYKIHCFSPYAGPTQNSGNEVNMENMKQGDYVFVIQDSSGKSVTREIKINNHR